MSEENIEKAMPWLNRILLAIIAYFAMQFNVTVSDISNKLDLVVTNQAVYALQINTNKEEIKQIKLILNNFTIEQKQHFQQYNYLYSEATRKKLEH